MISALCILQVLLCRQRGWWAILLLLITKFKASPDPLLLARMQSRRVCMGVYIQRGPRGRQPASNRTKIGAGRRNFKVDSFE